MATPRRKIVDEAVTPYYHCISRCVRKAFRCGQGKEHRKQWIEDRLRELVAIFAIDCAGFAIMDNHLHVLARLDSRRAEAWSAEETARRWLTLFPLRAQGGQPLPLSPARVRQLAEDAAWVARARRRLCDLGWFMKCLKEPLARRANKEDGCTGAFWEGRFRSIAVLDEQALLATAAYIDLNPFAAGAAPLPETANHTSLHARIEHCRSNGTLSGVCDDLSTRTRTPLQEQGLWLLPVDDCRDRGSARAGLLPGFTLSCYVRLVDWTSRQLRAGKAHLPADVGSLFDRLRIDPAAWEETLSRMFAQTRPTGHHFGRRASLRSLARSHGRCWHRASCTLNAA